MYTRELSWKLVMGLALPVVVALAAIVWFFQTEINRVHEDQTSQALLVAGRLIRHSVESAPDRSTDALLEDLRQQQIEAVIVSDRGEALVDTRRSRASIEQLLQRSEVRNALLDGFGQITWSPRPDGGPHRAVALKIGDATGKGLVWLSMPVPQLAEQPQTVTRIAAFGAIIGLATVLVLAYVHTRRWSNLLRRITEAATSISAGDLSVRADVAGSEELEVLARAINETRQRLAVHTETIDRQRRTFEALLTQLREGVVVVGADRRVVLINPAASRLLNLGTFSTSMYVGLALERCIPQLDLQRLLLAPELVANVSSEQQADTGGSVMPPERTMFESRVQVDSPHGTLHLLAHVSDIILPGPGELATGPTIGRVLVITDITELTRNLQMKTDFVTNASHELRTPLSTIRAAVETLQQLDWQTDGDAATRFVNVIERQSRRLEALASDLLDLSKLEAGTAGFRTRTLVVSELFGELRSHFAERIKRKQIEWRTDALRCDRGSIIASPQLLRLVLDNLIDNAIKFTDAGGSVTVRCVSDAHSIQFEVEDDGCGIPYEDQQRVFERFYQVERARSGGVIERGTGLGLSIVRHAISAMDGQVRLDSKPGEGTRITITIPQPAVASAA
ncbi:MAG: ATP-binding protein [Phycisphaerae bacterium]